MDRDRRRGEGRESQRAGAAAPPRTPGKATLSEQLPPVQCSASPEGPAAASGGNAAENDVPRLARAGVSGSASELPHLGSILRAFGRHDVSRIEAHVGGSAARASDAIGANAYATGNHVAFRSAPDLRTAAHEAAHVVQQRGEVQLDGGVGRAGDRYEQHADAVADRVVRGESAEALLDEMAGGSPAAGAVQASGAVVQRDEPKPGGPGKSVVDEVIARINHHDPEAAGGVGDYPKAFGLLTPLDTRTLLDVMGKLDGRSMLEPLHAYISAAPPDDRTRLRVAIIVVLARRGKIVDRIESAPMFKSLSPGDQTTIKGFAASIPDHWQTVLFKGEGQEVDRLVGLQEQFLEGKRKAAEDAARKQAEADAKAKGNAPPAPEAAPKVGMDEVLDKEVASRAIPPIPTKEWDDLSDKDKNEVWPQRARTAFARIRASIKGTELEGVMAGADFEFQPRKMLERGGYAFQDGNKLVCGMSFIKDAEADPKNVWPTVAHEIGGHAAYGSTYAKKVMDKFLARLPEAERAKWTGAKATAFFDAFMYAETEIFAALRQRRYDIPETGPAPVNGGMGADQNIEIRLTSIDQAFPKEVGTAILLELNQRVQADNSILARDKAFFVAQAMKHGYTL